MKTTSFLLFVEKYTDFIVIIGTSFLAYGLMIPWLGLYADDWTFLWSYHNFGATGLFDYFRYHRPVWGLTYQVFMPLIGTHAWVWHLLGLSWRIGASIAFYELIRNVWPTKQRMALMAGILFAIYPGYLLQPLSLVMGQVFSVYLVFLLSCLLTVLALRYPSRKVLFTVLALAGSLFNVLSMEYFLPLEILRVGFIYIVLSEDKSLRSRSWRSIKVWSPYLLILLTVTIWRAFFYKAQTDFYSLVLLEQLKAQPWTAIKDLVSTFFRSVYQAAVAAWVQPFIGLVKGVINPTRLVYVVWGITIASFLGIGEILFVWMQKKVIYQSRGRIDLSPLWLSLLGIVLAGIPFYVTGLSVESIGFNSRFTLPFILSIAILLAFVIDQIKLPWWQAALTALLAAAAIGFHFFTYNDFRQDALRNREMLYQLSWRIPGMKAGTVIVSNDDSEYFTDATLTAQINLIYSRQQGIKVAYGWIWPRELAALTNDPIPPGTDFHEALIPYPFDGNTSRLIAIQTRPNGCLRVVKTDSYAVNPTINLHGINKMTDLSLINAEAQPPIFGLSTFGREPVHGWCYYFEKADLALQIGDYPTIDRYYQEVQQKGYTALKNVEWFPFIEGLAMNGKIDDAREISERISDSDREKEGFQQALCQIWTRVDERAPSLNVAEALDALGCK